MAEGSRRGAGPSLSTFQALTVASQFGVTLAVATGLGLVAGQWLDGRLGTSVVFTLIGVFLGFGAAITGTMSIYRYYQRRNQEGSGQTATSDTPPTRDGIDH